MQWQFPGPQCMQDGHGVCATQCTGVCGKQATSFAEVPTGCTRVRAAPHIPLDSLSLLGAPELVHCCFKFCVGLVQVTAAGVIYFIPCSAMCRPSTVCQRVCSACASVLLCGWPGLRVGPGVRNAQVTRSQPLCAVCFFFAVCCDSLVAFSSNGLSPAAAVGLCDLWCDECAVTVALQHASAHQAQLPQL